MLTQANRSSRAGEAADLLGIHETTAKTHLQRIFGKTGTSRQAKLIQLLMAATPPDKAD
jgi:DNA-binding CsgD family transcriptional regulator